MKLVLDGKPVVGTGLTVKAAMKIADDDASGKTSSTATVEAGIKAIQLNCTVIIAYENKDDLSALTNLATAVDDKDKRIIYTVGNETANAMNMKKAKFSDNFMVNPYGNKQAWKVSFTLIEVKSVAEKKQDKQTNKTVKAEAAKNKPVAGANQQTQAGKEAPKEYEGVEKFLAQADSFLADLKN